jgi:broad specificity phosphatase PhoE
VIVFVRHGETDANKQGLLLGRADPPLNEAGKAQARAAAEVLGDNEIAEVVSSPLRRTRETAAIIAERTGLTVSIDQRLIEIDYGEWDKQPIGETPSEMMVRWRTDPTFAPPGGESLADLQVRMDECAAELVERAGEGVIVAVSHVSPIKAAVVWALGAGPELSWRMRLDVASLTRISAGPLGPVLLGFNQRPA